jgi:hypothetical protein
MPKLKKHLSIGLFFLLLPAYGAQVDTLSVISKAMQRTLRAAVVMRFSLQLGEKRRFQDLDILSSAFGPR